MFNVQVLVNPVSQLSFLVLVLVTISKIVIVNPEPENEFHWKSRWNKLKKKTREHIGFSEHHYIKLLNGTKI
jgi:hypothetical protein